VIAGCWLTFIVVWVVMALFVKRTVAHPASGWRVAVTVVTAACALVFRSGARFSPAQLHWQLQAPVQVACSALAVAGVVCCVWARLALGGNWSGGIVLKEHHELVQSGPYAIVRHPIYTGMIAMVAAAALYYNTVLAYLAVVAITTVFYLKSKREEQLMEETFPDDYGPYRERVRAIIPFIF
jgi:protein-S-isoprenylcysteine O-methyltransferase Ste14